MGSCCTKYKPLRPPPVYEAGPQDASIYGNMQTGTLAYFGPSPDQLAHVGVVINLTEIYPHSGPFLLESDTGSDEYDVLTGTNAEPGPRLTSLASRVRTMPLGWHVYFQTTNAPPAEARSVLSICTDIKKMAGAEHSPTLVAMFGVASGHYKGFRDRARLEQLWSGSLLRGGYAVSQLIRPHARPPAE